MNSLALALVVLVGFASVFADLLSANQCKVDSVNQGYVFLQGKHSIAQKVAHSETISNLLGHDSDMSPTQAISAPPDFGFLHEIVGKDGVKLIKLKRTPERFNHSAAQLAKAGIVATSFDATDSSTATHEELRQGCIANTDPDLGKCAPSWGCTYKSEQAIADSHRRALVEASSRQEDWTAIFEDDMVPMDADRWNGAFKAAWYKLQEVSPETKVVRLSWCMIINPEKDFTNILEDTGYFTLTRWTSVDNIAYYSGQCTGAYMVRKDIVPEMLSLFPCCEPVDNCYANWFNKLEEDGKAHGVKFMVSMQSKNSRAKIADITGEQWLGQHGALYQDRKNLQSIKGNELSLASAMHKGP